VAYKDAMHISNRQWQLTVKTFNLAHYQTEDELRQELKATVAAGDWLVKGGTITCNVVKYSFEPALTCDLKALWS
jgi:hypothetical protein